MPVVAKPSDDVLDVRRDRRSLIAEIGCLAGIIESSFQTLADFIPVGGWLGRIFGRLGQRVDNLLLIIRGKTSEQLLERLQFALDVDTLRGRQLDFLMAKLCRILIAGLDYIAGSIAADIDVATAHLPALRPV